MKFNVVSPQEKSTTIDSNASASDNIDAMIKGSPVFLFMKGTPQAPQCGFSLKVVNLLNQWGVEYNSFNVLSDPSIREGIKEYSNWPTIPQLYIGNEFIGGCDIIQELSSTGELLEPLQKAIPEGKFTPPAPPAEIKDLQPVEAKELITNTEGAKILDVRTNEEWDIVHLDNAQLLDRALADEMINTWSKDTPLFFICHSGMRSADAAAYFREQGFQKLYNIAGGIDAWAQQVDTTLERY